jgi:hypothetical protein
VVVVVAAVAAALAVVPSTRRPWPATRPGVTQI